LKGKNRRSVGSHPSHLQRVLTIVELAFQPKMLTLSKGLKHEKVHPSTKVQFVISQRTAPIKKDNCMKILDSSCAVAVCCDNPAHTPTAVAQACDLLLLRSNIHSDTLGTPCQLTHYFALGYTGFNQKLKMVKKFSSEA
jgi:hypothetical protein